MATPPAPFQAQFQFNNQLLLQILDPNSGEDGCSLEAGPGYFSTGGDVCFEPGMLAYVSGDLNDLNDSWEQMQNAIRTGNYIELKDFSSPPLPITAHWVMKDNRRPFGVANLDWDNTEPEYYPYPRPKKQCRRRSSQKTSNKSDTASKVVAAEAVKEVSGTIIDTTSSSTSDDDNDDGISISSSDACMMRALNGETFEGEYEYFETSETSSSGTSSNVSGLDEKAAAVSKDMSSENKESGTSSPFDALRSSQTENMVPEYMSSLSPPDESVNLTRSYAVPVGPSKQKPVMKFTPTSEINGVNMQGFLSAFQQDVPTSDDNIEIDDDDESHDGQYIEMDLALGVLEEKKEDDDIALQSESDDSSEDEEDEEDDEDVDAMTRLTDLKGKGKDAKGKKAMIEEL